LLIAIDTWTYLCGFLVCFLLYFFDTGSPYASQASLEFKMLLPQAPRCWDAAMSHHAELRHRCVCHEDEVHGLDIGCSPKTNVFKAWCTAWHCWEVVEPIGVGTYWEVLRTLEACPLKETVGSPSLLSFFYLLAFSSLLGHILLPWCATLARGPKQQGALILGYNFENQEPK
jgi:hypothetical protein